MLAIGKEIRYRIVPILDAHWEEFFQAHTVSLSTWRERRQAQDGIDPLRCSHCGRPMHLREVAFGPHARIAELFRRAAHPLRPFHPALARPP
jgi:hypothetical protein